MVKIMFRSKEEFQFGERMEVIMSSQRQIHSLKQHMNMKSNKSAQP